MASKTARRDAGSGGLYQDSKGLWTAAITLPDGPNGERRRKVIRSKDKAVAAGKLRDLRRELDRTGDLPTSSPTLSQWLTIWLRDISAKRVRPKTQREREADMRRYVVPVIGKYRLEKLTAEHVRRMHTYVTDELKLSSTTALRCHRVLSVALRDAMRSGRVTRNVADGAHVDAPPAAVFEARDYTQEEALRILATAATWPTGARWAVALLTGARSGETIGMQWDRFVWGDDAKVTLDWQLQRLTFEHGCDGTCGYKRAGSCPQRFVPTPADFEMQQVKGGLFMVRPKTKAGWRVIPLVDPLWSILDRVHEQAGRPKAGLVFLGGDGGPVDPKDDYQDWVALLAAAGVPRTRRHDARHTAASLLLALEVDTKVIQQLLGHASVITTRGYQHVNSDLARAALTKLGAHLTAAVPAVAIEP